MAIYSHNYTKRVLGALRNGARQIDNLQDLTKHNYLYYFPKLWVQKLKQQHAECIHFNKHLTIWCDKRKIVRNELYKHWFYELFRTASGALHYTCQFIWSMFAITAFVNSRQHFFTWHIALGYWHYWFKNKNMVAVWTPFMSIFIKHLHIFTVCFNLFFTKSMSLPIFLISLTLLPY